jgi:hypothetical protein
MAVTTPAMPASTAAVVNQTGQQVAVNIAGGTLTSVVVNGNQIGTTAGNYPLPPGASISITYSAAPAWTWTDPLDEDFEGYAQENAQAGDNELTDLPETPHTVGGETGLGAAESN